MGRRKRHSAELERVRPRVDVIGNGAPNSLCIPPDGDEKFCVPRW